MAAIAFALDPTGGAAAPGLDGAAGTVSVKVFQAPQSGHWPDHFGWVAPQDSQTNTVLDLAMQNRLALGWQKQTGILGFKTC